ncbi:hypothetical protein TNCV_3695771 [Trichonephila clavipes]|nr:hypothetical protein TNCV_3695771 [Trichonephila clavipes]
MPPLKFVFRGMGPVCADLEPPLERLTGIGRRGISKTNKSVMVQNSLRLRDVEIWRLECRSCVVLVT